MFPVYETVDVCKISTVSNVLQSAVTLEDIPLKTTLYVQFIYFYELDIRVCSIYISVYYVCVIFAFIFHLNRMNFGFGF